MYNLLHKVKKMANSDLVGSVVKAMDLVKITASAKDGLKMSELAEMANLKTMTCFNLIRTLVAGGFLEKINGRIYVGSEISHISRSRYRSDFFRNAEDSLLKLNRLFPRATTVFAVAGAYGAEQTHRIGFEHPGVIQRLNNEIMPPYASAAGLLTLAFIQDEDVKLRIEEKYPFSEFGINLWKSRDALNSFLEQCREERSAVSPFDTDIFFRVSVPVFDRSGKFAAVIGASCPVRYFPQSEFPVIQQELQKETEVFQKKIQ